MKELTSADVRQMFLDFFKEKSHSVEPSASLVPHEDPTLLWINSGVATLKKYFDGRVTPDNPRIVNAQKSIRTNDIENVGKTARHHTFFEMLGNFSIGDYFKEEAIDWGWEFLTSKDWIGFDADKLSVTIHPEDEEAYTIWSEKIGLPEERIIRLEGNFWDIGEGPSGPNTEIFYDRGEEYGAEDPEEELYPGGENERYLEIWNLVFSQFNHNPDGTYTPLPKKNIDTGMGLERMVSVIQDAKTNYDTDLFLPTIRETERMADVKYGDSREGDTAFKVVADHIRTVTFAIGDGALPSNEGRGYVLRRLLRRAVRFAKQIGINRPFMYELVPVVGDIMKEFYPEVNEKKEFIQKVIKNEEDRFYETLNEGLAILSDIIKKEKEAGNTMISGSDVFRLYDTYGFPVELTEEYAEEEGLEIDRTGFEEEMGMQRKRARDARQDTGSMQVQGGALGDISVASDFVGYEERSIHTEVVAIVKNKDLTEEATEGDEVQVILQQTPFYAESGGQVADPGVIRGEDVQLRVTDVQKAPNGQHVHTAVVESGSIQTGAKVIAEINRTNRSAIVKNHTATHLLHQALKDVLGDHVNQAGSLVGSERLRFDFSHFGQISSSELEEIEKRVNDQIWANISVNTMVKPIEEAKAMGAMALFGEKYGDTVRVVSVGDYSLELCGGTHVQNTAEIGLFKVLSESGIGAGTRRIEAVTSEGAYEVLNQQVSILKNTADLLKSNVKDVPSRTEALLGQIRDLQRQNDSLTSKLANVEAKQMASDVQEIDGVKVVAKRIDTDMNNLRSIVDDLKSQLGSVIVVLGSGVDGKVQLAAGITDDLIKEGYHAGKLIKELATRCGGGGGGRPDMAQAGGKNPEKLDEALAYTADWVKSIS
ncbi:alanine--tRNA ligase [Guptibacillus hwajinpoensis]|uniref:Alanine--tRNA ligase n=1 Tax=Guptibacillus hwajinpoensis TaxID=208199 RepID=A0A0J6FT91_9BACL|nr:alanine--tRNA ligase [Alkalihalobacillus macyae]KMM37567.1 alanine--tRNA ligase [Alkalihalobacillus macyae]